MNFFFFFSLLFLCFPLFLHVNQVAGGSSNGGTRENPYSLKAYLIRYWKREICKDIPQPDFLISKLSPLTTAESVHFARLAAQNLLSAHISSFCSTAKLFCFPDLNPSLEKHSSDSNFASYGDKNFRNYGDDKLGGVDSFKSYSLEDNVLVDSFRQYSRGSINHKGEFDNYGAKGNIVDQSFHSYGGGATDGASQFKNYNTEVNIPNLRFTSYAMPKSHDANGRSNLFSKYTENTNSGSESFTSYGKLGIGIPNEFTSYANDSNVIESNFKNYGEHGFWTNDSFTSYGFNSNVPKNNFKNYGALGHGDTESFTSYRDQSNEGEDSFESYGKTSSAEKINFNNYGNSYNEGTDKFTGYGEKAKIDEIGFKIYGVNNTFKQYTEKEKISFSAYTDTNSNTDSKKMSSLVNTWVEPGKFFRESMLKEGTVMPMPDIRDKMPLRTFLPRFIISKIPFSSSEIADITKIFNASENSTMEKIIKDALSECERPATVGETKRCISSIEDMIDFSSSVLGKNVSVRTTENVNGSKENVMVGVVRGINGGNVTKSVSCHQSLYPYLMYYCHSVPKVRVYEADLLDPNTKTKINHGVAICHLDTSAWSPNHGAFMALGSSPGRIEVCHWIFENDMTWAIAD